MALDVITLKSLTFKAKHGYYESERESGNTFEVDVIAEGNFKPSAETDNLSLTFDYEKAEEIIRSIINGPSEKLIESLCLTVGNRLFEKFTSVKKLTVALRKLNPPIQTPAVHAEIRMQWNR